MVIRIELKNIQLVSFLEKIFELCILVLLEKKKEKKANF